MNIQTLQCISPEGFHKLSYTEWGAHHPQTVLCVHGLTRNGRDFDWLAQDLSQTHRVVCPDMVGRGESDHLSLPMSYTIPQYMADCTALIARLHTPQVDWVGTSMGGLIGMGMASLPNTPIRRLIINDVGPFISAKTFERIFKYSQLRPSFPNFDAAIDYFRSTYAAFLSKEVTGYWEQLAKHSLRQEPDGVWTLRVDSKVALGLSGGVARDIDLWAFWEKIQCPILVLRGKNSDILPEDVLHEMKQRKPSITCIEFDHVGHAPSLAEAGQIACIRQWLA